MYIMIRVWLILVVMVFMIRLIRSHIELTRKIIIGVVALVIVVGGYIAYSQLFSIEADSGQVIRALEDADKGIVQYQKKTGKYPATSNDLESLGIVWPHISGGYRLADGYNLTNEVVVVNKIADRNCGANRAAVTINYQPYDVEHVRLVVGQ